MRRTSKIRDERALTAIKTYRAQCLAIYEINS